MVRADERSRLTLAPRSGVRDVIGTLIDARYRVEGVLGCGSMGVVFRGYDIELLRPVALKFLDGVPLLDTRLDRFQMEARSLAQIRHENVVQIYSSGQHAGHHYMAMELVSGRSLDTIIDEHAARRATVPLDWAATVVRRLATGLAAVHERLLIHRDVKPSNVVVEERTGRPVLIDFGLARRLSRWNPRQSLIAGTPCYMAPEQARDTACVSARSDIYALACTAFELLTGRPVFEAEDMVSMCLAHAETPPPPISSIRPELMPLDPVFLRALAKTPGERYRTCEELLTAFDAAIRRISASPPPSRPAPTQSGISIRSPVSKAASVRVLLLQHDTDSRRHVLRTLESSLRASGDEIEIQVVDSALDLLEAFAQRPADILVIDDDAVPWSVATLLETLRAMHPVGPAEIVVLSTVASRGLSDLGIREVPKPIHMQVLRSVIARMSIRIAESRVRKWPPVRIEPVTRLDTRRFRSPGDGVKLRDPRACDPEHEADDDDDGHHQQRLEEPHQRAAEE